MTEFTLQKYIHWSPEQHGTSLSCSIIGLFCFVNVIFSTVDWIISLLTVSYKRPSLIGLAVCHSP